LHFGGLGWLLHGSFFLFAESSLLRILLGIVGGHFQRSIIGFACCIFGWFLKKDAEDISAERGQNLEGEDTTNSSLKDAGAVGERKGFDALKRLCV
jgi:hypothetical protein